LPNFLKKDLHNDNWALKKNRWNSDKTLPEKPYYTQPKMLTSYSMNGQEEYILEDVSRSINATVAGFTIQKVENLIKEDDGKLRN
jgi:hypothetical protein